MGGTTFAKLGKTLAYSGILWHTLAYSGIRWQTQAYSGILWHTLAYSGIFWHTLAYSGVLLLTLEYSGILWHSSHSHPDLLLTQPTTHFFRSHRFSTLDLIYLSHYSYIKAIIIYKG